jgi:hypothetical protein
MPRNPEWLPAPAHTNVAVSRTPMMARIARYEPYRSTQRSADGVERAAPSELDAPEAVDGVAAGGSATTTVVGAASIGVPATGASIVTSTRPEMGWPSGPTSRHLSETEPGCRAGSGVTTSVSPLGPWPEPVSSVRTPAASISVTVMVANGTGLSNIHVIWVGAVATLAPSAGSLDTNVLCARAIPEGTTIDAVPAASAASTLRAIRRGSGRGIGWQRS